MDRTSFIKKIIKKLAKDKIPGGLGDSSPDNRFDKKQLEKGIQIEKEHTDDKDLAKEIAKDHPTEVPNYYITDEGKSRLDIMENDVEKELKD